MNYFLLLSTYFLILLTIKFSIIYFCFLLRDIFININQFEICYINNIPKKSVKSKSTHSLSLNRSVGQIVLVIQSNMNTTTPLSIPRSKIEFYIINSNIKTSNKLSTPTTTTSKNNQLKFFLHYMFLGKNKNFLISCIK